MDFSAVESVINQSAGQGRIVRLTEGVWKIDRSITVPLHITLVVEPGAKLEIAKSAVLSVEGNFNAQGFDQIFFGEGQVKFGVGVLSEVFPQWWGKIEGKDDTAVCQAALDSGARRVRFIAGVYAIDAVGAGEERGLGLRPQSNSHLFFEPGAILQALPTDKDDYTILNIEGKENVTVDGATIIGEREQHLGEGGEWGHGLRIVAGSRNITIRNVTVRDCWGDGIYLGEGMVEDILVENSWFDHNRRNGCSITNARNVLFRNCVFSRTNGTSPFKGVDLEPNVFDDVLQNIVFDSCRSYENRTGGFSVARDHGQREPVSVTFRNCFSKDDGYGFGIDLGPSDCQGILYINDCTVINPGETGFKITSSNLQTKIDGLYIVNPNQREERRSVHASGISLWSEVERIEGRLTGKIDARNVYVTSTDGKAHYAVFMNNTTGAKGGLTSIDIELKTDMPATRRFYKGEGPYNGFIRVKFSDNPVVIATSDLDADTMVNYIGQKITNKSARQPVKLSLTHPRAVSLDSEYEIEVVEPVAIVIDMDGPMVMPSGQKSLTSAVVGSRIKLRSDGKRWYVVEAIGEWK